MSMHTRDVWFFPGQGSQKQGMLSEVAQAHPIVQETFEEASQVLGADLWHVAQEGPEERLNSTAWTQPLLLTAGVAVYRAWCAAGGPQPEWMMGHSLGEYTALVCAQALSFQEAVALVHQRGRCMQEAVPEGQGAMAAVLGLSREDVAAACAQVADEGVVTPANDNAPGQIVIAGHRRAVLSAMEAARDLGAKRLVLLPVSVPSHCALMQPAAEAFTPALEAATWHDAVCPIVQNVSALPVTDARVLREGLLAQLAAPVRWVESVHQVIALGAQQAYESGPGQVLTSLVKRIDASLPCARLERLNEWPEQGADA